MFSEDVIRRTFLTGLVPNIQYIFTVNMSRGNFSISMLKMFIDRILQELSIRQDFAAQN